MLISNHPSFYLLLNSKIKKSVFIGLGIILCWLLYPVFRVGIFYFTDPILDSKDFLTEQTVNDASQVNQTGHGGVIHLSSDLNQSVVLIREALERAKKEGLKIMPMGSRHSMGKQSFQDGAILLNTIPMNGMEMDGSFLKVQAGARWFEVIRFLADLGLTVEIMQSNADFSSGNPKRECHGWQPGRPPVAQVWRSFRAHAEW